MVYYVYILLCGDGSFYTGYTKNLAQRAAQHANGSGARYTKSHGVERLAYSETYGTRAEAMRRERAIKKLRHQQKQQLVNSKP